MFMKNVHIDYIYTYRLYKEETIELANMNVSQFVEAL